MQPCETLPVRSESISRLYQFIFYGPLRFLSTSCVNSKLRPLISGTIVDAVKLSDAGVLNHSGRAFASAQAR